MMAETSARLNECDEIQVMADDDVSTANSDYNWEAVYKNIAEAAKLHLSLFVEPDGCVQGEISDAENRCKFPLRHVDMFVEQTQTQEGDRKLKLFGRSRSDDVEWCDVAQVRIYKASSLESQPVIVDAEVFEFDRHSSAEILVKDASVMHIKIEMRYIRQRWVELPKFTVGDLMMDFHDGEPPLQVYGALLALYSPHMGTQGPAGPQGHPGNAGQPGPNGKPGPSGSVGLPGTDAAYCPCPPRSAVFVNRRVA